MYAQFIGNGLLVEIERTTAAKNPVSKSTSRFCGADLHVVTPPPPPTDPISATPLSDPQTSHPHEDAAGKAWKLMNGRLENKDLPSIVREFFAEFLHHAGAWEDFYPVHQIARGRILEHPAVRCQVGEHR